MKNYKADGNVLTVTAPAGGVVSGQAFILGSLFLIAQATAAAGELVAAVRTGVVVLPKLAADDMTVGEKVNWDDTAKELKEAAGDLDNVATVVKAAGAATTEVEVVLTPV